MLNLGYLQTVTGVSVRPGMMIHKPRAIAGWNIATERGWCARSCQDGRHRIGRR